MQYSICKNNNNLQISNKKSQSFCHRNWSIGQLQKEDQLEFWDMYGMAGEELKRRYDAIGMRMQYCRYYAKGGVLFTPAGGTTREANGDMIYEYAYMCMPDPAAHV